MCLIGYLSLYLTRKYKKFFNKQKSHPEDCLIKDNYNSYGVHISKTKPKIRKGDKVKYRDNYRDKDTQKLIYFDLIGIWDGTKVEFHDKNETVIKTVWWLEKIKK
jgi:hypothetical protein